MSKPVLIDFFAEWCGPCKLQTPILEELKGVMGDSIEIRKVDVDANMSLAQEYQIRVVPTLVIEKDKKVIHRLEGVTEAEQLRKLLSPLVD